MWSIKNLIKGLLITVASQHLFLHAGDGPAPSWKAMELACAKSVDRISLQIIHDIHFAL